AGMPAISPGQDIPTARRKRPHNDNFVMRGPRCCLPAQMRRIIYPRGTGLHLSARLDMHVRYGLNACVSPVEKRGGDPVSVTARAVSLLAACGIVAGVVTFVAIY